jgi:hypothetical protein
MGLVLEEIGTHSFRKGVATSLSSSPGGPNAITIWLRAGWSIGAVQSRYLFQGPGGDQFAGRAATGLDVNDFAFSALPPHFNEVNGPVLTTAEWEDILTGYSSFYPQMFRVALPYLLASLCFHKSWLQRTLPPQHPLFLHRVWRSGILDRLLPHVCTGLMKCKATGLRATGIPPQVVLLGINSSPR